MREIMMGVAMTSATAPTAMMISEVRLGALTSSDEVESGAAVLSALPEEDGYELAAAEDAATG